MLVIFISIIVTMQTNKEQRTANMGLWQVGLTEIIEH